MRSQHRALRRGWPTLVRGEQAHGARAVGIHPFHIDPYDDCHQVDDHDHAADVADLADKLVPR
ncbi:hypothetical protein [Actinopolymorpha sp. B9G3]|uniref:hypothetical protein n=1 Tax=Actinopolymorpha sp. B9G3 TaxID=3158970 RepID=UPI0032D8C2C0